MKQEVRTLCKAVQAKDAELELAATYLRKISPSRDAAHREEEALSKCCEKLFKEL